MLFVYEKLTFKFPSCSVCGGTLLKVKSRSNNCVCFNQPYTCLYLFNIKCSPRRPAFLSLSVRHSQKMDDSAPRVGRTVFACLVGASQVLGLAAVVLTGVWMGHYRGGFAWDGSAQEFNLHPLCMVLGLVFLQGDGESVSPSYNSFYEHLW